MNTEELTIWHNTIWWPAYRLFIETPFKTVYGKDPEYGAGGRGESLKKILTLNPSEKLRETMITSLKEQTEHRQMLGERLKSIQAYELYTAPKAKKEGLSIYKNRQSRTYIYNLGWHDEIPHLKTVTAKPPEKRCACGNPIHEAQPELGKCYECLYPPPCLKIVK